jgi:hypothetical protein
MIMALYGGELFSSPDGVEQRAMVGVRVPRLRAAYPMMAHGETSERCLLWRRASAGRGTQPGSRHRIAALKHQSDVAALLQPKPWLCRISVADAHRCSAVILSIRHYRASAFGAGLASYRVVGERRRPHRR